MESGLVVVAVGRPMVEERLQLCAMLQDRARARRFNVIGVSPGTLVQCDARLPDDLQQARASFQRGAIRASRPESS